MPGGKSLSGQVRKQRPLRLNMIGIHREQDWGMSEEQSWQSGKQGTQGIAPKIDYYL